MDDRRIPAAFGASLAVSAMVTAGACWTSVLLGWTLGGLAAALLKKLPARTGPGPEAVTLALSLPLLAAAALGAEGAFPADSTFPFVSMALLGLLWRAMAGGRRAMGTAANILGMVLLAVAAVMLAFGLEEAEWSWNLPQRPQWSQVLSAVGATLPWWRPSPRENAGKRRAWFAGAGAAAVGLSLLTSGVLGPALAGTETFPLYRAVQGLRFLGVVQRLEALAAAAVLMGGFCLMLVIGLPAAAAARSLWTGTKRRWAAAACCALVFLLELLFRTAMADTPGENPVFWGYAAAFTLWIVFFGKHEKTG